METAIEKKSAGAVTRAQPPKEKVEARDILIPKVFVLNPMSRLCTEEGLKPGSIVRSTDAKVIGDCERGVEFVPISYTKMWKIERQTGSKYEHVRWEPITPDNAQAPWEWAEGLVQYRRNQAILFYTMLLDDIEREKKAMEALSRGDIPDVDDIVLPTCITFSRSSYHAGKVLLTHFAKTIEVRSRGFNLPFWTKSFVLKGSKEKKDDAVYFTLDVTPGEKASAEAMEICARWSNTISAGEAQVHDAEETETANPRQDERPQF